MSDTGRENRRRHDASLGKRQSRQAREGGAWRRDERLERLAAAAAQGHRLSPSERIQLGFYNNGKAAAEAEGLDVTGGN
ncbi:MAG: hypothetical protein H0W27_07395 [Actinobacteria bacterium]|nr:hypothetical protein [Actinomycetota bacterium]